jgi:1-deoxy-D-xylulose-5-phosphate synthase
MALLAAGTMTAEALKAADLLAQRGINASVISASSVKPLDDGCIRHLSARRLPYVTIEEHVLAGGFGSAVAEHCAAHGLRLPDEMIALPDAFIPHGAREDLIRLHGLDSASIAARVSPLANRTA